jgi:hypothetical protein
MSGMRKGDKGFRGRLWNCKEIVKHNIENRLISITKRSNSLEFYSRLIVPAL